VTGYVDQALDPESTAEVRAHIEECPSCRSQVEFERGLKTSLRAIAQEEPTQEVVRRVLRGATRRRSSALRWSLPSAAVLAAVMILGSRASAGFLSAEMLADHLVCFSRTGEEKVFVSGPDPGPVAAWLAENGSPIPPPPRSAAGLALLGARRCMLVPDTSIAAHLLYQDGSRETSVFVLPDARPIRNDYSAEVRSHSVRLIRVGGHTVGIVSDTPVDSAAIRDAFMRSTVQYAPTERRWLTTNTALATIFVRPGGL
jgi:hypothetical protein